MGKVVAGNLRGVGGLEAGRRHAVEVGHGDHTGHAPDHVLQRVGQPCGVLNGASRGHEDLHGKLVTLGDRHQLLRQLDEGHATDGNRHDGSAQRQFPVGKALLDGLVVESLHDVEQIEGLLPVLSHSGLDGLTDAEVHEDGQQGLGDDHADEEHDGDGPGKHLQEVVHHACHRHEEGEERDGDAERGREDALQEMLCGQHGTAPAGDAQRQIVDIAVDDDD